MTSCVLLGPESPTPAQGSARSWLLCCCLARLRSVRTLHLLLLNLVLSSAASAKAPAQSCRLRSWWCTANSIPVSSTLRASPALLHTRPFSRSRTQDPLAAYGFFWAALAASAALACWRKRYRSSIDAGPMMEDAPDDALLMRGSSLHRYASLGENLRIRLVCCV